MRHGLIVRIALLAPLLGGCLSAAQLHDMRMKDFTESTLQRVAFEMSCPREQISVVDLTTPEATSDSIGVSGCGKRAVYMMIPHEHTWINNTGVDDKKAEATR